MDNNITLWTLLRVFMRGYKCRILSILYWSMNLLDCVCLLGCQVMGLVWIILLREFCYIRVFMNGCNCKILPNPVPVYESTWLCLSAMFVRWSGLCGSSSVPLGQPDLPQHVYQDAPEHVRSNNVSNSTIPLIECLAGAYYTHALANSHIYICIHVIHIYLHSEWIQVAIQVHICKCSFYICIWTYHGPLHPELRHAV